MRMARPRPRPRPRAPALPELPVLPGLPAGGQASACPRTRGRADARPSRGCGHGVWFGALRAASRDGFALPVLARLCQKLPPEWRGHSCLRGAARADRNVCPTLPRSITAACRDGFALPVLARFCGSCPGTRRQPTTANDNRQRLASGRRTPSSMTIPRPFMARHFLTHSPGCCPGLVYRAPSGLS